MLNVDFKLFDAKVIDGCSYKCVVWDSTCNDTVAPSYEEVAIRGAGDDFFLAVAVEILGPWCCNAKSIVKDL